jgi:uncharacterized membrane protein YfcA
MSFLLFLAFISCTAGFFGGMTGTGGIIIPPLLIWLYGISPHVAMAMAQASFVVPSMLAVAMFVRKSQFEWRIAFPIAFSGFVSSFLAAAYIKPRLDGTLLTILFAGCISLAGVSMLRKSSPTARKPLLPPWRGPVLVVLGILVGTLAGITGSGSNAILVPIMVFFGIDILAVLAAGQFFSVLTSSSGTIGNALNMDFNMLEIIVLMISQMIGIWLGVGLAQRMDTERLKKYVGLVCLLTGLFMLYRALA